MKTKRIKGLVLIVSSLGSERGVPVNAGILEQLKPTLTAEEQLIFDFIDGVSKHSSDIDPNYPQDYRPQPDRISESVTI